MPIRSSSDVAELVEAVSWDGLPESVRAAAERNTLHVLGTMFLGTDRDISRRVLAYARNSAPGSATVIGLGKSVAAGDAALANATVCHADFRDDAHAPSQSHPGVTVIPAALAAAETVTAPVPAGVFGEAIVAGYQVIGRLGRLGAITSTARGFRASAIYSVFGGTVAAAKVLGLDRDQLGSAIALAAHTAAGLNQPYLDGTDDWILLPGLAAKSGLAAALLAREGIVGAPRILEGEIGFYKAYADADLTAGSDENLPDWEVAVTRLKTVLTCGWNQAAANALIAAGTVWPDVDRIEITLSNEAAEFPGVANHGPFTTYTAAVLSLPYGIGSMLRNERLDSTSYADVTKPEIEAAGRRVAVKGSSDLHGYDTSIIITMRDGSQQELHSDGGEIRWLLTASEVADSLHEKYRISGVDSSIVDELATAVPGLLSGSETSPVLEILGQTR